jgi:hypothetical protein
VVLGAGAASVHRARARLGASGKSTTATRNLRGRDRRAYFPAPRKRVTEFLHPTRSPLEQRTPEAAPWDAGRDAGVLVTLERVAPARVLVGDGRASLRRFRSR